MDSTLGTTASIVENGQTTPSADTSPLIKFSVQAHLQDVVAEPYRASKSLPRWYREIASDVEVGNDFPTGTVKRCMPVFDILTAGYIIPIPVAVRAIADEDRNVSFSWRTGPTFVAIESHSPEQVGGMFGEGRGANKWVNPWKITTPPGYSCLFITPANRPDLPFECFSAIVDTDTYQNTINFPFFWKTFPYDKVLDQGEPMMQVIPFKRDEWGFEIEHLDEEGSKEIERAALHVRAKNHQYKSEDHHRKHW